MSVPKARPGLRVGDKVSPAWAVKRVISRTKADYILEPFVEMKDHTLIFSLMTAVLTLLAVAVIYLLFWGKFNNIENVNTTENDYKTILSLTNRMDNFDTELTAVNRQFQTIPDYTKQFTEVNKQLQTMKTETIYSLVKN